MGVAWKEMAQRFWTHAGVSLVVPKEPGGSKGAPGGWGTQTRMRVVCSGQEKPTLTFILVLSAQSGGIRASQRQWQALAVKQVSRADARAPFLCL